MSTDQRDRWRKAIAAYRRTQRNRRGKRRDKQITGIRWTPPKPEEKDQL